MRDASLEDITKFLACGRVAFIGVSRHARHFSRLLFREFAAQGFDPVPVNPNAPEIEGRKCFARIAEVSPPVRAALLMTGTPGATDAAIGECSNAHIDYIWIYKDIPGDSRHAKAVESCRERGSAVVEGYCPFMFLPHAGFIHRAHRFFMRAARTYPSSRST